MIRQTPIQMSKLSGESGPVQATGEFRVIDEKAEERTGRSTHGADGGEDDEHEFLAVWEGSGEYMRIRSAWGCLQTALRPE